MSDQNYKSSNLIKKKKKMFFLKILGVLILFGLIVYGTSYLSKSDNVKITDIQINDTKYFDKVNIENIVKTELEGDYFYLLGKNNIILFPKGSIIQKIKNYDSAIKKVSLHISGVNKITINIEEYNPVALWCAGTDCYYLNENGQIFIKAPAGYDQKLTRFNDVIADDPMGKNYTDADSFKKIIDLIKLINKINIQIKSLTTKDNDTFYLYTDSGVNLLYHKGDDPVEIANNLKTVIDKDAINIAQLKNIEYIDLRFGNKVYYKIR